MDKMDSLMSEWIHKTEHDFQALETLKEHNPELEPNTSEAQQIPRNKHSIIISKLI